MFLLVSQHNSSFDNCSSFSAHVSPSIAKWIVVDLSLSFHQSLPKSPVLCRESITRAGKKTGAQVHRNEVGAHSRKTEQVSR